MNGYSYEGKVAAVTGAASGIGRALAVQLAAAGARVAVSDVDGPGMDETVGLCRRSPAAQVRSDRVDVSDRQAVTAWADDVAGNWGRVDVAVNNAGVAVASTVLAMADDDIRWLMDINFWGVVHGTKAFLPHLVASGDGHLVNLSSVFGLVSVPSQAAYNASKFAVRGYGEALSLELRIARTPVTVTTVMPGGIRTNIAHNARIDGSVAELAGGMDEARSSFDRVARTSPERAAEVILAGVARGRRRILVGSDARVLDLASRFPLAYQGAVVAGARLRRRR